MNIIERVLDLRRREHLCTVDLLEALLECDRTRTYLDHGYESLWKKRSNETEVRPTAAGAPMKNSRHIPTATRDAVFLRDGERCLFVSKTGQRCQATHHLQIDHIVPFALGGSNAPENLRVLCGAHNRRRAERTFTDPRERGVPDRNSAPHARE